MSTGIGDIAEMEQNNLHGMFPSFSSPEKSTSPRSNRRGVYPIMTGLSGDNDRNVQLELSSESDKRVLYGVLGESAASKSHRRTPKSSPAKARVHSPFKNLSSTRTGRFNARRRLSLPSNSSVLSVLGSTPERLQLQQYNSWSHLAPVSPPSSVSSSSPVGANVNSVSENEESDDFDTNFLNASIGGVNQRSIVTPSQSNPQKSVSIAAVSNRINVDLMNVSADFVADQDHGSQTRFFSPSENHFDTSMPIYGTTEKKSVDNLSKELAIAMEKLTSEVQSLVAEEVLLRLLHHPLVYQGVSSDILSLVRDHMFRLPAKALLSETIRLDFVPLVITQARGLFPVELAKSNLLSLRAVDLDGGTIYYATKCIVTDAGILSSEVASQESSTLSSPAGTGSDANKCVDFVEEETLPYWLVIVLNRDSVQLCFHTTPLEQGSEAVSVVQHVKRMIQQIVYKVNQRCLLGHFNENRACSHLLLAYDPLRDQTLPQDDEHTAAAKASEEEVIQQMAMEVPQAQNWPSSGNSLPEPPIFTAGQFACPRVLALKFSLHDRLNPELALQNIGLYPFQVSNRRHIYLYRETNGNIFYLQLSTVPLRDEALESHIEKKTTSQKRKPGQIVLPVSPQSESKTEAGTTSPSLSPRNNIKSASPVSPKDRWRTVRKSSSASGLKMLKGSDASEDPWGQCYLQFSPVQWESSRSMYLTVYGIDPPGEEICLQLPELIRSRLEDLTLSCINNLLARNPLYKLLPSDHHFIRPPVSSPDRCISYPLLFTPSGLQMNELNGKEVVVSGMTVKDPYLFLNYFKQNVSSFLHPLCLSINVENQDRSTPPGTPTSTGRRVRASTSQTDFSDSALFSKTPGTVTNIEPVNSEEEPRSLHGRSRPGTLSGASDTWEDGSVRAQIKPKDFTFIYNIYNQIYQGKSTQQKEQGLSTVYVTLIRADTTAPVCSMRSHFHNPGIAHKVTKAYILRQYVKFYFEFKF